MKRYLLYTFTLKNLPYIFHFLALIALIIWGKKYIIQLLKELPDRNENIILLFISVDFVGFRFFSFPLSQQCMQGILNT